jgi:hypothetical protein
VPLASFATGFEPDFRLDNYSLVIFLLFSTPFHFKRLGQECFITVAIGKAWQVFNVTALRVDKEYVNVVLKIT